MWVVTGPFDGLVTGETSFKKQKLLKPGKSYVLGRKESKDCQLVVNHKKVSRKHIQLAVGTYSAQNVEDPGYVPKLDLHVFGANRQITRDGERETINADTSCTLRDQDTVHILGDLPITVKWEKVVCYCPPGGNEEASVSSDECAQIGLATVWNLCPDVTHHITEELLLTPAHAVSLLNLTTFVKADWINALVNRVDPLSSLENEFSLPPASHYRPRLSASLPSALKNYQVWEPDEERLNMLKPFRVIFLGERGREISEDYRELVRRGGATYECCSVEGGRELLHRVLAKGSDKGKDMVIIADQSAMIAAIGDDEWDQLFQEAADYKLRFIPATKLIETVVRVELSYLDCRHLDAEPESILPDVVLNTHPSEPTIAPVISEHPELQPRKRLVRRATSRSSSQVSSLPTSSNDAPAHPDACIGSSSTAEDAITTIPLPRKRLPRRAGMATRPMIFGIEDPDMTDEVSLVIKPPQARSSQLKLSEATPEVPIRSSRLKRRFGNTQQHASQLMSAIDTAMANVEDPPHKKYKALFDQSDPDRATILKPPGIETSQGSLTQPESPIDFSITGARASTNILLPVLREETEESFADNPGGAVVFNPEDRTQGAKRTLTQRDEDEDIEMGDQNETDRTSKRRTLSAGATISSMLQEEGSSNTPQRRALQSGGSIHKDKSKVLKQADKAVLQKSNKDKDEKFLKAVASTKRGKRLEDEFDIEFNNLKISKPNLERNESAGDLKALEEFGDDGDLRGNFMVVVEMELHNKDKPSRQSLRSTATRADWEGRLDFKKFKKKVAGEHRKPVELVLMFEDGELEMAQGARRLGSSYSKSKTNLGVDQKQRSSRRAAEFAADSGSDDDTSPNTMFSVTEKRSKTSKQTRSSKPQPREKGQPLFLEESDPEGSSTHDSAALENGRGDSDDEPTQRKTRTNPSRKRPGAALVRDDDSDDEISFKNLGARKKARR